jgi:hypothetical protein
MERGLWYSLEPEAKLVMREKTEGLWEELLQRFEPVAQVSSAAF